MHIIMVMTLMLFNHRKDLQEMEESTIMNQPQEGTSQEDMFQIESKEEEIYLQ